jgi:hypothetical protein
MGSNQRAENRGLEKIRKLLHKLFFFFLLVLHTALTVEIDPSCFYSEKTQNKTIDKEHLPETAGSSTRCLLLEVLWGKTNAAGKLRECFIRDKLSKK